MFVVIQCSFTSFSFLFFPLSFSLHVVCYTHDCSCMYKNHVYQPSCLNSSVSICLDYRGTPEWQLNIVLGELCCSVFGISRVKNTAQDGCCGGTFFFVYIHVCSLVLTWFVTVREY